MVENFDQKKETRGGKYKNPRVFTEQGVMMLATILKTDVAVETTIRIMDAFVLIKKYVSKELIEKNNIYSIVMNNQHKINKLEEAFQMMNDKRKDSEIFFNGQIFDAYSKIYEVLNNAKKSIIIIDNYADCTILNIIKRINVNVIIVTKKNNLLTQQDIDKYNRQYHYLKVIFDNTFHDRYFIIDKNELYHCGASVNRIGYKTFSITKIGDKEMCNILLKKIDLLT